VFEDADIGDSVSWFIQKKPNDKRSVFIQLCKNKGEALSQLFKRDYKDLLLDDKSYNLNENGISSKLYENCCRLGDISEIIVGIKAYQTGKGEPKQTKEIVDKKVFNSTFKVDDTYIQCIVGRDFHRYNFLQEPNLYISYGKWLAEPRESAPFFDEEKIIIRQTSDSIIAHIDDKQRINLNNVYNVGRIKNFSIKYILALLNSKLLNFIYQNVSQEKGRLFAEVKKVNLVKLPIKIVNIEIQNKFDDIVNELIEKYEIIKEISQKFQQNIQIKYNLEYLQFIQDWYVISFKEFVIELKKRKVNLTISEEVELENIFIQESTKLLYHKSQISTFDSEIDKLVYQVYELTDEEIAIIEGSFDSSKS
jgi:polyhydroxyalkanoate synthesis regulator phasin